MLYGHKHLVTHGYCSELLRSSSNLIKKTRSYVIRQDLYHQIFLKSAKLSLTPLSKMTKCKLYFRIQIYLSNRYNFWWNYIWLSFFTMKRFLARCVLYGSAVQFHIVTVANSHSFLTSLTSDKFLINLIIVTQYVKRTINLHSWFCQSEALKHGRNDFFVNFEKISRDLTDR